MHRTFFVFLKYTIQGGSKVDVLLIAFLHLWLKFCKGIDKYQIVPIRKLFYFHHWITVIHQISVLCLHDTEKTIKHTEIFLYSALELDLILRTASSAISFSVSSLLKGPEKSQQTNTNRI